ncbi:MAG: T9SS type A sorting domain-containing protein, partial [Crocinitomicaceae bacterium]
QFELYPNPNNGNGTITWTNAEVERVNVVNAAGQVVNSIAVENTTSVTFDGLTAGVYVAQVVTADHTQTIKFIVQ